MKKTGLFTAALFAAGVAAGCAGHQTRTEELSQMPIAPMEEQVQQVQEVQQVSPGDELQQFAVRDQQGQTVGQIDQVLVDLAGGKIGYIITSSPQQPEQRRIIPWNALQVDPLQQTLVLPMSAVQLQQAPSGDAQVVIDSDRVRQLDQFFGVAPVWGTAPAQPEQVRGLQELQQFSVVDRQGQKLGQVNQVLVDVPRGQIGYVVVASQQQPGQKHVIPWNALQPNPVQQTLVLPLSAERFRQAPIGDAQLVRDTNTARQLHQFYGVVPYYETTPLPVTGMTGAPPQMFQQLQVQSVDSLKQFSLQDQQGQRIGQVNQVLIDLQRGQIGYVVVTSQQGQRHLIPWNALRIDPQQQTLAVPMTASQLQQLPIVDERMVQDMNQARQIHQFFGVAPYWESGQQQPYQQMPPAPQPQLR